MTKVNAFAQYMLELVNRFRSDPAGEFARIVRMGHETQAHDPNTAVALSYFDVDLARLKRELAAADPVAPLAWNATLADTAGAHSALLRQSDSQSHQVVELGEPGLGDRVLEAGYDYARLGENVYSYAQSVRHALDAFIVDWGAGPGGMQRGRGHRETLLSPEFREIGIGVAKDTDWATEVGRYVVTQDLGVSRGSGPFLLGVAYDDHDGDAFYTMGEGRGGLRVRVEAEKASNASAGGYAVAAGEGVRSVLLKGSAVAREIRVDIDFGAGNVKLDVVDGAHLRTSGDLAHVSGAASITAIGRGDVGLTGGTDADVLFGNSGRNRIDGGSGDDRLSGGAGNDRLLGRAGADRLTGGKGDDKLGGGHGDDRLGGGEGRDVLRGGAGRDRLSGGPDEDVFVFGRNDDRDRILDWEDGDSLSLVGVTRHEVRITADDGDAVVAFAGTTIIVVDAAGDVGWDDIAFA